MKRLLASLIAVVAIFFATLSPVFADTTTSTSQASTVTTTNTVSPDSWMDLL